MKKIISLVTLIAMLLSATMLAGCSGEDGAGSGSETTTAAKTEGDEIIEEVTNNIQERLDAGEEVFIGYSVNTLSNPFLKLTVDYVKENFEAMGVTVTVMACEGDSGLMVAHIENFIEMQVDLIICAPLDQAAVKNACVDAMEQGIPVVFNGQYPSYSEEIAGGAAVDYSELGVQVAKMGSAWIDQAYPDAGEGEIHAAVLSYNNTYIFKLIYDSIMATAAEDPRINITYTGAAHNSLDLGYNAAEEALTMDPDIKLFLVFQESPAIGVNNYLKSQPGLDLSEFAIFAGSFSDTSAELVTASTDNQSALRGACNYGTYGQTGEVNMAEGLFQVVKGVLLGTAETPFWVLDDIWTVDTIGYDLLIDNPENDFLIG